MSRDGLEAFEEIAEEFYPGSSRKIPTRHPNRPEDATHHRHRVNGDWDDKPRIYKVNGLDVEFFTVGHLASALGRQPGTIRKWEREGLLPKATYRVPSQDPRGQRRLYTRAQVLGIVKIAQDEGVLISHAKPIKNTQFTPRVIELFKNLPTPGEKAAA